jgi:hypothetical protein
MSRLALAWDASILHVRPEDSDGETQALRAVHVLGGRITDACRGGHVAPGSKDVLASLADG